MFGCMICVLIHAMVWWFSLLLNSELSVKRTEPLRRSRLKKLLTNDDCKFSTRHKIRWANETQLFGVSASQRWLLPIMHAGFCPWSLCSTFGLTAFTQVQSKTMFNICRFFFKWYTVNRDRIPTIPNQSINKHTRYIKLLYKIHFV